MVTADIVSDVLRVLRVEHLSKDELISSFCERPSD